MRYVILDTETTGLSPQSGHKMVEIGAIAVRNREVSSEVFHHYINPLRDIPQEVVRIHGITNDRVKGSPAFPEIADQFLDFIEGSTLVIHNAAFDLNFIMSELSAAGKRDIGDMLVVDTLAMARKRFVGQKNSLDLLCDRFNIDRQHRNLHGALLDSELLAEVYLAMTGGRQFSLLLEEERRTALSFVRGKLPRRESQVQEQSETAAVRRRKTPPLLDQDQQAHIRLLERIMEESGGALLWQESSA
ncbi:MAG: DNA polymerase III subunit epsilon [Mariprofundales bacterium]|nr:DNA polymerase III subunit epsilon [Mariprofundales bacterium]